MTRKRLMLMAVFFTVASLAISGCSFFGLFGRDDIDFRTRLKLKVAVLPFENNAGIQGENIETNTAKLVADQLVKSRKVMVMPWPQVEAYIQSQGIPLPITRSTAPIVGRALGLNAIVIGNISEVSQIQKRASWKKYLRFIFKRNEYVTSVLLAKVIDVENGVILGADVGSGSIKTGQSEEDVWLGNASSGVSQNIITKSMDEAVDSLSQEILRALSRTPWKGFIVEANDNTAIISAGSSIGIRKGDKFVSFAQGETVTNAAGQAYNIPGPVKARFEASQVMPETTELKIISGSASPGEVIQNTN